MHVPGLQVAAGGQVIENAEGFNIGPATAVGVVAAMFILLITFGSLAAAGMPLITAGLGLITGVALIELATHVTNMSNVSPDLALMIGLGVGIDYALFIVTRFRENYLASGDLERSVVAAMDTSGRAILLAGATVVIALLGMFATGVAFMYGLAIAAVLAVLLTLVASLTLLPALLAGASAPGSCARAAPAEARSLADGRQQTGAVTAPPRLVVAALERDRAGPPVAACDRRARGDDRAARPGVHDAARLQRRRQRRGRHELTPRLRPARAGLRARDSTARCCSSPNCRRASQATALPALRAALSATPGVVAVTQPRIAPSGTTAVLRAYPDSAPQALATTNLVNHLRGDVLPAFEHRTGVTVLVGGFTASSIDFSHVLSNKLPLFLGIVILLSALLLFVIFRSLLIAIQAALMNLLTIGASLGVTVAVFEHGWFASVLGVQKGPIEAWVPVLMFAVVFGLSMDYEVFLISRVREQWVRHGDASAAAGEGVALTGRVISAAAAIMVVVFLSFTLGNERTLKEFGFGLAVAVFLDALVVRCMLLPAVLELLGPRTWRLPRLARPPAPPHQHRGRRTRRDLDGVTPDEPPRSRRYRCRVTR